MEADHVIPRGLNGKDSIRNMQTLCKKCHYRKTGEDNREMYIERLVRQQSGGRVFVASEGGLALKSECSKN
jgi:hypothetical protein